MLTNGQYAKIYIYLMIGLPAFPHPHISPSDFLPEKIFRIA
jgi:hypothetical protein